MRIEWDSAKNTPCLVVCTIKRTWVYSRTIKESLLYINNKVGWGDVISGFKKYVNDLHLYQGHYLILVKAAQFVLSADAS